MTLSAILLSLLFSLSVHANPAYLRTATPSVLLESTGVAPQPTARPDDSVLIGIADAELKRRQYGDVCGYLTGDAQTPITCAMGYECAVNTYLGAMGCCAVGYLQYCQLPTTCIDYANLAYCDESCQTGGAKWLCNAEYPYCATFRSTNGAATFRFYECATIPNIELEVEATPNAAGYPTASVQVNTITATYIATSAVTAGPIIQNYYDNSTANQTNVYSDKKGGLSKGELAGAIVGSVSAAAAIVTLLIACCK